MRLILRLVPLLPPLVVAFFFLTILEVVGVSNHGGRRVTSAGLDDSLVDRAGG